MALPVDSTKEDAFTSYMLHQVCCDVILAFQQSHKLTASNLTTLYVGDNLKGQLVQSILQALMTQIVNLDLSSQVLPIIHYAQICNLLIKETPELHQQVNQMTLNMIKDFEFDQCRVVPNLVEFHVFLNCQQDLALASHEFLGSIKTAFEQNEGQFKKIVNYYLSFCCLLGYHKTILEKLSEDFHDFMPSQDILKPTFSLVRSKDKRESSIDKSDVAETKVDQDQRIDQDVSKIMDVISQKGDLVEPLTTLLNDSNEISSSGLQLKQIFLEIILTKYGGRSLEHISEGIRRVKPILDLHYQDQEESQRMALDTIFKAYNMD